MNLLEEARYKINEIDAEMAALFVRRMRAVEEVAAYKQERGLPIFDAAREQEMLDRCVGSLTEEALRPYYAAFLKSTISISKRYQSALIGSNAPVSRRLSVSLGENSYDILIERGILCRAGDLLKLDRRVLIVTDDGVPVQYALTLAAQCKFPVLVTLPQGEATKNEESLRLLWKHLLDNGFTRGDCVVALGGGVIGDLAGLCAATYLRGIEFYNLPTTLLSMVDSSIGGKTAIDFEGVKNIVGAFYQPKKVLIDPDVLRTLSPRQISNGMAEVVKMSMTSDAELFEMLEEGISEDRLEEVIERALLIKKVVVEADERESGLRRVLNFGHTLGHGIEAESANGEALLHGECVALGMLPMCSESVRARLIPVLKGLGLPTCYTGDLDRALAFTEHDKKRSGQSISVILVDEIGSFRIEKMPLAQWICAVRAYNFPRTED